MKLSEAEINHDLLFMRGEIKEELSVNQGSDKKNQDDIDEEDQSDMNLDAEESKASTKGGDRRQAAQSRPARNKAKPNVMAQVTNSNSSRNKKVETSGNLNIESFSNSQFSFKAAQTPKETKESNGRNEPNGTNGTNASKRQTRRSAKME